jgi:hypothetical protein
MLPTIKPSNLILALFGTICAIALLVPPARASELPYLGEWSNGRGETLVVTARTMQFGNGKPATYRDITRATDGETFHLQITAGRLSALGEYLQVSCSGDKMRIVSYVSGADLMHDENVMSDVTWFRDK